MRATSTTGIRNMRWGKPLFLGRELLLRAFAGFILTATAMVCSAATLSFDTALDAALQNHPQIQNAQASLRASGYTGDAARWARWPNAQLQTSVGSRYKDSVLLLEQPLWNGGKTQATIDAADARTQAAVAGVHQTAQDLVEKTADAYLQWAAAWERIGFFQHYVDELDRLKGVIERRAQASVASAADVQQAQVRLEQAQVSLLAAEGVLNNTRLSLQNLTLMDSAQWAAQRPEWPTFEALDAQTAWHQCEDSHPSLAAIRAERATLNFDNEARRDSAWPQLALRYRQPLSQNETLPDIPHWQLSLQAQTDGALVARSNVKADAERLNALQQRESAIRLQLDTLLNQAAQDEQMGTRQYQAAKNAADNTQALVASAMRQFEVGRRTWLDVLNAVREAHEAQLAALSAKLAQFQAAARLRAMAQALPALSASLQAATPSK